ncbi:UDP-4-amino-4,6-dideoxy-N-acetyl-beta-L-altrosamine transaminase [Nitratifractor sp.]
MEFIPYGKQWIAEDDIEAVVETLRSDYLTTGPKVRAFEKSIAEYCGAQYAVAVSSGTAALHLASLALLEEGEKVLTTPNSFLATSNALLYAKARPIFVDIAPEGNIDLDLCEEALKKDPTIKAIYPVAFSGRMLDQESLAYLREKYAVKILEDCAHAIGAEAEGIKAASCVNSDCSILSFHPVKHMTTGEGGAVTTNDPDLYRQILLLRNHGMLKSSGMKPWEYEMHTLGFNYRITDMQCALGLSQLKKLDRFIHRRIALAKNYDAAFSDTLVNPLYRYDGRSSYHLYVVRVDFERTKITKEELFIAARERGIGLQLHYIPINKQPYYRSLGYGEEPTPVMDRYYREAFSLPIYPKLTDEQQRYVIETILDLLDG